MALKTELVGLGFVGEQAAVLGCGSQATGLTAAGSTLATALVLSDGSVHTVGTTAASTGVKLNASIGVGDSVIVQNDGANALTVYPHSATAKINGGTAGAGVSVAAAAGCLCVRASEINWVTYTLTKET